MLERRVTDEPANSLHEFFIRVFEMVFHPVFERRVLFFEPLLNGDVTVMDLCLMQITAEHFGRDVPFDDDRGGKRDGELWLLFPKSPFGVLEDVAVACAASADREGIDARFVSSTCTSDTLQIIRRVGRYAVQKNCPDVARSIPISIVVELASTLMLPSSKFAS